MAELTVYYQGETLAELSASGELQLQTAGRFCADDITVRYARPTPDLLELEVYVADFLNAPPTVSEGSLNSHHRTLVS